MKVGVEKNWVQRKKHKSNPLVSRPRLPQQDTVATEREEQQPSSNSMSLQKPSIENRGKEPCGPNLSALKQELNPFDNTVKDDRKTVKEKKLKKQKIATEPKTSYTKPPRNPRDRLVNGTRTGVAKRGQEVKEMPKSNDFHTKPTFNSLTILAKASGRHRSAVEKEPQEVKVATKPMAPKYFKHKSKRLDNLAKDSRLHRNAIKKKQQEPILISKRRVKSKKEKAKIPFDGFVVVVPPRTSSMGSSVSSGITMEDVWDLPPEPEDTSGHRKTDTTPEFGHATKSKSGIRDSCIFAGTNLNGILMSCTSSHKIQQVRPVLPKIFRSTSVHDTAVSTKIATTIAATTRRTAVENTELSQNAMYLPENPNIDLPRLQRANVQAGYTPTDWWSDTDSRGTEEWMGNKRNSHYGVAPKDTNSSERDGKNNDSSFPRVRVTLDDFDIDHLSFLRNEAYDNDTDEEEGKISSDDDEESCEDSEKWIVKHLERNSSFLYWLQLTTELREPRRLIQAMAENDTIRNVTVYPAVFRELSAEDKELLVAAICTIQELQNLIVFHDCGNLFLKPLIKHRPPLRRLTLYKLDIPDEKLLSELPHLLRKYTSLEELAIEKYKGAVGGQLLLVMAGVLPTLPHLKTLTLTPAKNMKISKNGTFCLFRSLSANRSLRALSLQGSEEGIDQTCINELINALQVNCTVEDIKLSGFWRTGDAFWKKFEPKSKELVAYYMKLNQSGIRQLQLDVNASFEKLQSALVSNRDNLDHIFYLLLNNPSMVQAVNTRKSVAEPCSRLDSPS